MSSTMRLLTFQELLDLPQPEWLIEDTLPVGSFGVVFGEPETYKSFVAFDMGLSIAKGLPWQGRETRQGDVLFIIGEGLRGTRARLKAWQLFHKIEDAPIRAHGAGIDLTKPSEVKKLIASLRKANVQPDLIVVDTLARCLEGNESATEDMNKFVKGAAMLQREFDAAVLVVHHCGKDQSKGERGSTALRGAADTMIRVSSTRFKKPKEGWRDRVAIGEVWLECSKQKDADHFDKFTLDMVRVELDDGSSLVPRETDPATAAKRQQIRLNDNQRKALEALQCFGSEGATYTKWKERSDLTKNTFGRARDALIAGGAVEQRDDRYYPHNPQTTPTGVNGGSPPFTSPTPTTL